MRKSRKPRNAPNWPEILNATGLKSLILAIMQLASNSCEGWNHLKGAPGGKLGSSSSQRNQLIEPMTSFMRHEPRQPFDSPPTADGSNSEMKTNDPPDEPFVEAQEQFKLSFQGAPEYSNIRPEKQHEKHVGSFKRGRTSTTTTSTQKPSRFWIKNQSKSSYDESSSTYDNRNRRRPTRKKPTVDNDNEDSERERQFVRERDSTDDFVRFGEATVIETLETNEVPKPFYTSSWLAENEAGQKRGYTNDFPADEGKQQDAYSEDGHNHKKYHFTERHPATPTTTTSALTEPPYHPNNFNYDSSSSGTRAEPTDGCLLKGFKRIGSKCYFHGNFPLNWFKALEFCNSLGLEISLAAIETKEEDDNIKEWMKQQTTSTKGVWIGGSDNGHRGTWVWLPTGQPVHYHNWGLSQPTGIDQHCMFVVGGALGYQWADFHCDYEMHFLCEHHSYPFHHEFRQNTHHHARSDALWNGNVQKRTRYKNGGMNWLV